MRVRLAAAVLLAIGLAARGSEPLMVVAPADGTVLRGGSVATISWTATGTLPKEIVEWEAFLSVDGGCYFATRITPHLDIDIRTFQWPVPNVTSDDVRLLIRIGDEREERSVDVPLRLAIVADPGAHIQVAHVARSAGEPARRGDPGVAAWVAGDRKGRKVALQRAPARTTFRRTARAAESSGHGDAVTPVLTGTHPSLCTIAAAAAAQHARTSSPLLARDILLLVRRRNI
ncbi:MAG TPA: hypothetical protein VF432_26345 [Thermoanaerobaculia bacterium]